MLTNFGLEPWLHSLIRKKLWLSWICGWNCIERYAFFAKRMETLRLSISPAYHQILRRAQIITLNLGEPHKLSKIAMDKHNGLIYDKFNGYIVMY